MTNVGWSDYRSGSRPLLGSVLPLKTDSYKACGHWKMLPNGTTNMFSYGESRGSSDHIKDVVTERDRILRMSHEDAIKELLVMNKIESRIKTIQGVADTGLLAMI